MVEQRVAMLRDVAERAGVSPATASRVLSTSSGRRVSPALRAKVEAAARELGYEPNFHAQSLGRARSNLVGLVVHDIADPYFAAIAAGVMQVAGQRGMLVLLGSTFRDPEQEIEFVTALRGQRVHAIVLAGSRIVSRPVNARLRAEVDRVREGGGRVAVIGQDRLGTDAVLPDNRGGARKLAEALVRLGHRRFAVLAGDSRLVTARERTAGFLAGLKKAGLDARVVHTAFTRDGGYDGACRLLASPDRPSCVFAVNDVMAIGAMSALRSQGLRVPADISVAGFDDIPGLSDQVPSLTTVRLPLRYMGERVLELVLADRGHAGPTALTVSGDVVVRESTRSLAG